tara:strand:- start:533 stop:643 length:111 start_codon:yes stop_codon:yes gene_type:complete
MRKMNLKWAVMAAAGAVVGAVVVYQLKKHTKGLVDD